MSSTPLPPLSVSGSWFTDSEGARYLLRGVNLGGSSKIPSGADPKESPAASLARPFTFVGRPFPLKDADTHFRRLKHWGFNVLRFLVTWEAIEPREPGQYDEHYLEYVHAIVKKAGEYGLYVFIDPHQDAWSRFSGGDGAPAWTLDAAGFDISRIDVSEAAIVNAERGPDLEPMIWPNNWTRLAPCTMFTLFFAGSKFAPQMKIGHEPIQDFLQDHFIRAMCALAERLKEFPHVLGYDSLNEPGAGYIGVKDLSTPFVVYNSAPQLTGLESLSIPSGITMEVPYLRREGLTQAPAGTRQLNPNQVSAWKSPAHDIWRRLGVWDVDAKGRPVLLKPDYFAHGKFISEGLNPFARRYAEALRKVDSDAILFIEGEPGGPEPLHWDNPNIPVVNASHWYDLLTLILKRYNPEETLVWGEADKEVRGRENVRRSQAEQIKAHVDASKHNLKGCPTLIGEFGTPMDLDGGRAYRTGDFSAQTAALDAYFNAMDANLAHATLWNYTADNTNARGDGWNGEDLSIFSRDQAEGRTDADAGARGVMGFCRPYVRRTQGTPTEQVFDRESAHFELEVESSGGRTEVYVPRVHYPRGYRAEVSEGTTQEFTAEQKLEWEIPPSPTARKVKLTLHRLASWLLLTAALGAFGARDAAAFAAKRAKNSKKVEVVHWWTAGGEATALRALKDAFEREGGEWIDAPVAGGGGDAARSVLKTRFVAANPPGAAQILIGPLLLDWANEGVLLDLQPVADAGRWDAILPPVLAERVKYQGRYVAVPVNIHRVNWMWTNPKLLAKAGIKAPRTWEEFDVAAEKLQKLGVIPFAHGGQAWQETLLFEVVALGVGGADFYRKAFMELDPATLEGPTMQRVFDRMRKLKRLADRGSPGRDWNLATTMVMRGEAAFQFMGDWAKGEITAAGLVPGRDVLCVAAPGTEGAFSLVSDAFMMMTGGAARPETQQRLATLALEPAVQEAFNLAKGSIPARNDAPLDRFDSCAHDSKRALTEGNRTNRTVPSFSAGAAAAPAVSGALFDIITAHFNSEMSSSDAAKKLGEAARIAARRQK